MNQVGNASGHSSPRRTSGKPRGGFTLVELIVVIVIISIIIAFILTAAIGGIRTAEEKATQSLIAKLDAALSDRLEALMESRPDPCPVHISSWRGCTAVVSFNAAKPVSNRAVRDRHDRLPQAGTPGRSMLTPTSSPGRTR